MSGVLGDVLEVFDVISQWIGEAVQNVIPMFYTETGLTFLGVLAVCSLGFAVIFLIIGIIQNFLHWRS